MITFRNEKFKEKRTGFEPACKGKVPWFEVQVKYKRHKCLRTYDTMWENRTIRNSVPCTLFLTCFWDILVDPLQRMLQSNGKITELKTAAIVAILLFFLVGTGHAGASPLNYKRNSPGGKSIYSIIFILSFCCRSSNLICL